MQHCSLHDDIPSKISIHRQKPERPSFIHFMSILPYMDELDEYPICKQWFCELYFTPLQIFLLFLLFGRFTLAIIILLLGLKMEKDFMRTITMAIFIPMTFCEIFNIYCEVVAYLNQFSATEEQYTYIAVTFLEWTYSFLYVIYDYVHYNVLIQLILLLYCCRLAYQKEEILSAFPINTICLVVQVLPFFLSVLYYVTDATANTTLRILSIASRVVMIVCFTILTVQIFMSFLLLCRVLPYTHANSTDMQLRDARSRLAWTLVYLILPYIALLPFLVNAFAWLIAFSGNPGVTTMKVQTVCEMLEFIFHFHRPLWMTVITVAFLPPYRRAMLLTVICCGCCPKITVEPLPRKPQDMSLMYRYADI
ncbi:unnamed protein product [Cylicocyclus nassatus]|uniref:Uncharacterized protein n=1 Tax=Cylicocyclus nassatus TaxID=53992 RepID=A0AA36GZN7_CYLNA|nr:unnamed protein product [Cylicocyclus nassatus]